MNKNNIGKVLPILTAGLLTLGSASCTRDFQDINTNQLQPTDEILNRDNIRNSVYLPDLQFNVVFTALEGTNAVNDYQILNNLTADSWVGYMAPTNDKWDGKNLGQFYFDVGWNNMGFNCIIPRVLNPWMQTRDITMSGETKSEEIFSIAQICKIMAMQKATDMFGAIPYSEAGNGSFTVAYDSQESVYKSFLKELTEAVDVLYRASGRKLVVKDYVYNGDAAKWARLGNSLMLRVAMRTRFVDPELAKKYVEQACAHPAGVISSIDDQAQIDQNSGVQTINSLHVIAETYDDTRMGASIYCYLTGYRDPRLDKYFKPSSYGDYVAVPPALPNTGDDYKVASKPLTKQFGPTIWMRASEVAFLRAEGALAGFAVGGGAKELYEEGVKLSFAEQGVEGADSYLRSTAQPAVFSDHIRSEYSAGAPSEISPRWDSAASEEVNLERIITQKYLALFPNGQEAWTEWRRTGYPRLLPANTNISNFDVITSDGHKDGVRCWPYPLDELNQNKANVQEAINKYKGGSNGANINVWWDTKDMR